MRHLMSPLDLSVEELDKVLDLANDIEKIRRNTLINVTERFLQRCFMSQVPRTRLSFESAMLRLGGKVLDSPVQIPVRQPKVRV